MHIDNVCEFEELVRDINGPLLIFFVTRWTKNAIDWGKINKYKKNINIISIDVDNMPELMIFHHLSSPPSAVLYQGGWYRNSMHGYSSSVLKELVEYYGVK